MLPVAGGGGSCRGGGVVGRAGCSVVAEEKMGGGEGEYWREGWCLFVRELDTGKGESGGGGGGGL